MPKYHLDKGDMTLSNKKYALKIREKHHRLPLEYYRGIQSVAFEANLKNRPLFFLSDKIVRVHLELLEKSLQKNLCLALVYCFMPDHFHIIIQGTKNESNSWQAMVDFKQYSGYWFKRNHPSIKWQKDFYDHIIRKNEDLGAEIRYILENPVRKKLVTHWDDYPFCGSLGIDLKEVLETYGFL